MKNIFFLVLVSLFASCIVKVPPDPPTLTVKPDTNVEISPISPVTFTIKGFGAEDLTKFEIETTPFFYKTDTVFQTFVHSYDFEPTLHIPELLPGLGEDSIVKVVFTLYDGFNAAQKTVNMKVVSGYPVISQDTAKLTYSKDTMYFYSTRYKEEMYYESQEDRELDFVLIYDETLGFVLASPSAFFVSTSLLDFGLTYNTSGKNHTRITRFTTPMGAVTPKFLYYMEVTDSFIDNNTGNGVGEENLEVGDMLAFETNDGRKGVLQVTSVNHNTKSLSFYMKIQIK